MEILINKLKNLDLSNISKQDANDMIDLILTLDKSEIKTALCVIIDFFSATFDDDDNFRFEDNIESFMETICINEKIEPYLEELQLEEENIVIANYLDRIRPLYN